MLIVLLVAAGLSSSSMWAGPKRYTYEEDNAIALRELRNGLKDLRHEISNHDSEIHTYEEKFKTLEVSLDALREQFQQGVQHSKEMVKGSSQSLEGKIASLETVHKNIISDLRQFKTYAADSTAALAQYKQKINELEKVIETQNQNIEHLQTAIRSLMDLLQPSSSSKTYKVANGDSLEKIARKNQTSIKALKDLNNLASDKITVGQVLKIPEK